MWLKNNGDKKMKLLTAILVSIFTLSSLHAQVEDLYNLSLGGAKYFQDFLNFAGEDGKTKLDVFIHVPYQDVQFVKTGEGFEAAYSVTVSVYDEEKESLLTEKIWSEKIVAYSFDEAVAAKNFNLSHRSFNLKPGTYLIRTAVMDKDSREEIFSENLYTVRDLSIKPSLSDVMLIAQSRVVEGSNKIIPNITRHVFVDADGLPFFFEVYSDSASQVSLEYVVSNMDKEVLFQASEIKQVKQGSNQAFFTFKDVKLNLGKYLLYVYLKDNEDQIISYVTKSFISRWIGVPNTIQDLNKAVEQLRYIASPDEMDYLNEAETDDIKAKRFVEFWKNRDPNPTNEQNQAFAEYFRRVAYADENFSHYVEGWRSDRGMVFIILGSPDNIDRHPFEYDSKPYEVWQYYDLNHSFVFMDETGFGDYRLTTPLYGDLFRYRY
jgi:GWxTD domain-containing protein